jgi:hypothetical protein
MAPPLGGITPRVANGRTNTRSSDEIGHWGLSRQSDRPGSSGAFRENGEDRIQAYAVKLSDLEARMREISENLHRAELKTEQRYEQIAEYARLVKKKREQELEVSETRSSKPQGGRPFGPLVALPWEPVANKRGGLTFYWTPVPKLVLIESPRGGRPSGQNLSIVPDWPPVFLTNYITTTERYQNANRDDKSRL